MSPSFEERIHIVLKENVQCDIAADVLLKEVEANPKALMNESDILSLSFFLLHAGFCITLIHFVARHIRNENFPIPWGPLLEALGRLGCPLEDKSLQAIKHAVEDNKVQFTAAKAISLHQLWPELIGWQKDHRQKCWDEYLGQKLPYINDLKVYRSQGLWQQEKDLLKKLYQLFPQDEEIFALEKDFKNHYAEEIIQKYQPSMAFRVGPLDAEDDIYKIALQKLAQVFLKKAKKNPTMAIDLAVGLIFMESYDFALQTLDSAPESVSKDWLQLELFLKNKKYLQVLEQLPEMEKKYANDPEVTFASAYLKAQSMWGLGQKSTAMAIIESLLSSRPHYRSAASLLRMWRNQ
ncbi:MAG: hypothetical protein ACOYOK_04845 [Pseudobdellovibrionaceae bacterium]